MDMFRVGIFLTVLLIGLNGFLIFADATLPPFDGVSPIFKIEGSSSSAGLGGGYVITDENVSSNLNITEGGADPIIQSIQSIPFIGAPLVFLINAITSFYFLGNYLYLMAFGWADAINLHLLQPIGLGLLGTAITSTFMIIEAYMIYQLLRQAVSAIRGGGG